jgi:hypothetical protein
MQLGEIINSLDLFMVKYIKAKAKRMTFQVGHKLQNVLSSSLAENESRVTLPVHCVLPNSN